MQDSFERGETEVQQFFLQYGQVGKAVLRVLNDYDFLELNPNNGDVPADEYLDYAKKFMETFSIKEDDKNTEVNIAIILFTSFSPEQFLGINRVYKFIGDESAEYMYYSLGSCQRITPEDIIAIAKRIFVEIKKLNIKIVSDNTEDESAQ